MICAFRNAVVICLLFCFSSPVTAQDEGITQEFTELSEAYAEIEQQLNDQSTELDRVLKLGYSGPGLGKDLADIAENVAGLERRLQNLGEQMADLIKKINYNPIRPFELIVHKDTKDAPPLSGNARPGDKLYLTAAIKHAVLAEDEATQLSWVLMLPDGTASEKLRKSDTIVRTGDGDVYSFGIDTTGMALGTYEMELVHNVVGRPKQQFKASIKFTLAEISELKITKMVIDDERTGDVHQHILPDGAFPYMFAYFEVPNDITNLTADINVRDLTVNKIIYEKTGVKKIKPDEQQQRFGVVLDPVKIRMTNGHEYRFYISLKDNLRGNTAVKTLKTVADKVTFFYGDEPKRIKIQKLAASNVTEATSHLSNIPMSSTVFLSGWYKATRPVDSMDVLFRLTPVNDSKTIFEKKITVHNQKDVEFDKVTVPVDTKLLKEGTKYILHAVFSGGWGQIEKSDREFTYAKLPPLDIRKLINVSGSITTQGKGHTQVKRDKYNALQLDSKVSFKVPVIRREGMEGFLYWKLDGVRQPRIALDGSNNNWGFSFDAKSMGDRRGYDVALIYLRTSRSRPSTLYTANFRVSLPFTVFALGADQPIYEQSANEMKGKTELSCDGKNSNKRDKVDKKERQPDWMGHAWLRDKVAICVEASNFDVKAKVTIEAILKETGETLISESKTINLAAKEKTKLEWKLDQPALKFDLNAIFPNIDPKRDFKKTIETKFTVEDDKGYKTEEKVTTTQWLYYFDSEEKFKHVSTTGTGDVGTILPPSAMQGPYKTTIKGFDLYYTEGLKVKIRSENIADWVKRMNIPKVREDGENKYFAKTMPILIMVEDNSGKQGLVFWREYTFTARIAKPAADNEGN